VVEEHFAKKKKEAKTVAKQENIKSNEEMTEGKNEISVRYINGVAVVPRHIYNVFSQPINQSRFKGKNDIFV
jgi:head-tail adaptor